MPRSFEVPFESPAGVDQVHAAFCDTDYWLARFAAFHAASTLDSLSVDSDGTVAVAITQHLGRQLLPGLIAKLVPGDLRILHTETWSPAGDGSLRGDVIVSAPAAFGSGRGSAVLAPSEYGSRLEFNATIEFRVPLVGGAIERYVAREFAEGLPEIQRFTAGWVTQRA